MSLQITTAYAWWNCSVEKMSGAVLLLIKWQLYFHADIYADNLHLRTGAKPSMRAVCHLDTQNTVF